MGAAVGSDPIYGLSTLPFLVSDFAEAKLLHDIARPTYEAAAERYNQKLLFTAPWPPSGIHAQRPVTSYEDIEGLRIRTYDRNGTDVLNEAGANALVMSWGDVYPALATGTIDSVLTSAQSAVTASFWEVLTDYTRVNFAIPLNMITINLDTWNSLSSEQQEAIMEVSAALEQERWQVAEDVMISDEERLAAEGMTVVTEISDEFAAALNADGTMVASSWLESAGDAGQTILDEFSAQR
jgi:TRAP-type C4-dicarboxylate transport system substrate-binding protein